jgi:transcriptional regulator with XRE-family HTH domain
MLRRRSEGLRQYDVARAAGLHPTTLSTLLNDIVPLKENDPRVLAIGRVLGVPDADCFEPIVDRSARR